jgi:hypothetical protein
VLLGLSVQPLAANARFTEDAKELRVGEGLWKTAGKLRPFRTDFLDATTGTAATHAVVEESGMPAMVTAPPASAHMSRDAMAEMALRYPVATWTAELCAALAPLRPRRQAF